MLIWSHKLKCSDKKNGIINENIQTHTHTHIDQTNKNKKKVKYWKLNRKKTWRIHKSPVSRVGKKLGQKEMEKLKFLI